MIRKEQYEPKGPFQLSTNDRFERTRCLNYTNRTGEHMEMIRSQSTPHSYPNKKNTATLISKTKENTSRLSGIHYNIVQGFLSLKGLSEAGMPMRRGSFLACSWQ